MSRRARFRGGRGEAYSPAVAAVTPENRTFDHASLRGVLDGRYGGRRDPGAGGLGDAFGIPDEQLAAPIGVAG